MKVVLRTKIIIATMFLCFLPTESFADTFPLPSGSADTGGFEAWIGGEYQPVSGSWFVSYTVTSPLSITAGTNYSVSITQSPSFGGGVKCGGSTSPACDSSDFRGDVSVNSSGKGTLNGATVGNFNTDSNATGDNWNINYWPIGPFWSSADCVTFDAPANQGWSVSIVAPPDPMEGGITGYPL